MLSFSPENKGTLKYGLENLSHLSGAPSLVVCGAAQRAEENDVVAICITLLLHRERERERESNPVRQTDGRGGTLYALHNNHFVGHIIIM